MTLKPCPCCKKMQTTRSAKRIGKGFKHDEGFPRLLFFNCADCHSTFTIGYKKPTQEKAA